MPGWLTSAGSVQGADPSDDKSAAGASAYRLEALEPRLLLSADPISGEFARIVQEVAEDDGAGDVAAIIQEYHDAGAAAPASAADAAEPGFEWPAGWDGGDEALASAAPADLRSALVEALQQGADASGVDVAEAVPSAAEDAVEIEGGDGPVTLGAQALDALLADVAAELDAELAEDLTILIGDLDGDRLVERRGNTVIIDADAGGRGWQLDADVLAALAEALVALDPAAADVAYAASPASASAFAAADAPVAAPASVAGPARPSTAVATPPPADVSDTAPEAMPAGPSGDAQEGGSVAGIEPATVYEPGFLADAVGADTGRAGTANATGEPADRAEIGAEEPQDGEGALLAAVIPATQRQSRNARASHNPITADGAKSPSGDAGETGGVSSATESDEPASSDADDQAEARAPPADQAVTSSDEPETAGILPDTVRLADANEGLAGDYGRTDDRVLVSEPETATLPRGPPAHEHNLLVDATSAPLAATPTEATAADLEAAVARALDLWGDWITATGADASVQAALDALRGIFTAGFDYSTLIADLPGLLLGEANAAANTFQVDLDAAGYGWFVDASLADNAEFDSPIDFLTLASTTIAGNPVDLLTVVLHEIGHLLGLDHDSGLPVMADELTPGQRILAGGTLDLSGVVLPAGSVGTATITLGVNGLMDVDVTADDGISPPVTVFTASGLVGILRVADDGDLGLIVNGPDQTAAWTVSGGAAGTAEVLMDVFRLQPIRLAGFDLDGVGDTFTLNGGALDDDFTLDASFASPVAVINGGAGNDVLLIEQGAALARFDGGDVVDTELDAVINRAGAGNAPELAEVENFIDQPLLFVHGFGGTLGADTTLAGQDEWLTRVGLSPDKLVLEPLQNSYDDILVTLANIGYQLVDAAGAAAGTLVNALWDWRVPVADTDATADGELENATWANIGSGLDAANPTFDTALDYLVYWMDLALEAWQTLTGSVVDAVDLITHSTGGLVAKSYLQSAAYALREDPAFLLANPDAVLPAVDTLVQVGVPNQGSGSVFNLLNDDFSQKKATRVLQLSLKQAWELYQDDPSAIVGPDGATPIVAAGATETQFIAAYVGTLEHLLAVYPFIDDGSATLQSSARNDLLLDLNSTGIDSFVAGTNATHIIYASGAETQDIAVRHVGFSLDAGTSNEVLRLDDFLIGGLPDEGETWYQLTNADYADPLDAAARLTGGDGTVSTLSAAGGFVASDGAPVGGVPTQPIVTLTDRGNTEHTDLVNNDENQKHLLARLLGLEAAQIPDGVIENADTPSVLVSALRLLEYGILPIEPLEIAGLTIGLTPEGLARFIALFDSEDNAFRFSTDGVIQVDEFLVMSGRFAFDIDFDKVPVDISTQLPGDLTSLFGGIGATLDDVPMSLWKITAEDVNAFAGLNGWQDLDGDDKVSFTLPDGTTLGDEDGDGIVDVVTDAASGNDYGDLNGNGLAEPGETAEFESGRVGLEILDLDVAVAWLKVGLADKLANPLLGLVPKLHAVKARAASASLVGLEDVVGISVDDILIEISSGGKWRKALDFRPVADYRSTFPSELLFFDSASGSITGVLEVADAPDGTPLRNALAQADAAGSGNGDGIVTYQELVNRFDGSNGGTVDGELSTTELPELAEADLEANGGNGDDVLDDLGIRFPLAGGSDALVIDFDANQRLGASAGHAMVTLGSFIQAVGGLSIEKGPREQVDIATRFPANVGDLVGAVIDGLATLGSAALEALGDTPIPGDVVVDDLRLAGGDATAAAVIWDGIKNYYNVQTGDELTVGTVITSAELKAFIEAFRESQVWVESDLSVIHNVEVETLQFGMNNVLAFAGIGGLFWADRDGDNRISFTDNDGNLLSDGDGDGFVDVVTGSDGRQYGDINENGDVDVGETGEFNRNSIGLAVNDVDLGFVQMTSTLESIPGLAKLLPDMYALQASANFAGIVGLSSVLTAQANDIRVEVNSGEPWTKGAKFGPVVDFATSFPGELAALDTDGDGRITAAELDPLPADFLTVAGADGAVTYDELLAYYDDPANHAGAVPPTVGNGLLEITELPTVFTDLDADGDGKLDPAGYEIRTATGALPIYITSPGNEVFKGTTGDVQLRRGAFVEILAGGMSVEKGPTETVDVATGIPRFFGEIAEVFFDAFVPGTAADARPAALEALREEGLLPAAGTPTAEVIQAAIEEWKRRGLIWVEADLSVIHNVQVSTLQVGFADANAFLGLNPPNWTDANGDDTLQFTELSAPAFWTDLDGDDRISFTLPDGTTLADGDGDSFVDVVTLGDEEYGDINRNGIVDVGESAELDSNILGIIVENVDFGLVQMAPTLANIPGFDEFLPDFTAAFGSANSASLQGLGALEVQLALEQIEVFMNDGKAWFDTEEIGTPVVDFRGSFPGELLALDYDGDGQVERFDDGLRAFEAANGDAGSGNTVLTFAELLAFYDDSTVNAGGGATLDNGLLDLADHADLRALQALDTDFDNVITEAELLAAFDTDNDDVLELDTDSLEGLDWTGDTDNIVTFQELLVRYDTQPEGVQGHGVLGFDDGLPAVLQGIDADFDEKIDPVGFEVFTGTGTTSVYLDFDSNQQFGARIGQATGSISDFVHISGSVEFVKNVRQTVNLAGGALVGTFNPEDFGLPANLEIPVVGDTQELEFITIGGTLQAFIGKGPGFEDANDNGVIEASELNDDAVGILAQNFEFALALMKPSNPLLEGLKYYALKARADQLSLVGVPGVTLEARELLIEINQSTPNVFGISLLPVVDFASSFPSELKALDRDGDGVVRRVEDSLLAFSALDDGDGALTYDEFVAAYDTDASGAVEFDELPAGLQAGLARFDRADPGIGDFGAPGTLEFEELLDAYDTNNDGVLRIDEDSLAGLDAAIAGANGAYEYAELLEAFGAEGSAVLSLARLVELGTAIPSVLLYADTDEDGLLDPAGLEVGTGGRTDPVYLAMDSFLVRAQGQVELDIAGALTVVGSVAYEQGPVQDLVLTDGTEISATTFSLGFANVSAFVGVKSRDSYWADANDNNEVDTGELDPNAIGIAISDLDIGLALFVDATLTDATDIGVYLAGRADVPDGGIELVGVPGLVAEGSFSIAVNLGLGTAGLDAVDFRASIPGETAVLDTNGDGVVDSNDAIGLEFTAAAFADAFGADGIVTYEELLAYYDDPDNGGNGDGLIRFVGPNADTGVPEAVRNADADGDDRIDAPGYQVNTGNADAPVFLDFDEGLLFFEAVGLVRLTIDGARIAEMNGFFLFDVTADKVAVLAQAELSLGPDTGDTNQFFTNRVTGAFILNGQGVAAELQSIMSLGADLTPLIDLAQSGNGSIDVDLGAGEVRSRIVLNTTLDQQRIEIPVSFEDVIDTTPSATNPIQQDASGRFFYVIQPNAPPKPDGTVFSNPERYVVVEFAASLDIVNTILFDGSFRIAVSDSRFEINTDAELIFQFLGVEAFRMAGSFDLLVSATEFKVAADASMSLGILGSLDALGAFEILDTGTQTGVRALIAVSGALGSPQLGLTLANVSGSLALNTLPDPWNPPGGAGQVRGQSLTIGATAGFDFGVLASGSGTIILAFERSSFQLVLDGDLEIANGAGLRFDIFAFVGIFTDGVVVDAAVDVNFSLIADGFLSGTLSGRLQINTRPVDVTSYTSATLDANGNITGFTDNTPFRDADGNIKPGIDAGSFLLDVNGDLTVLGLIRLDGSVLFEVSNGGWSMAGSLGLDIDLFGLASAGVSADIRFNSDGEFQVTLRGTIQLGPDGFNLSGTAFIDVRYFDGNGIARGGTGTKVLDVTGSLDVNAEIFFIPIDLPNVRVDYSSATKKITATIGPVLVPFIDSRVVDLGFLGSVRIYFPNVKSKNYTFTIGTLSLQAPPPPPVLAEVEGGALVLNVGTRAGQRNLLDDEDDEVVLIDQSGNQVSVTMFGTTQKFDAADFDRIVASDMGAGDDVLTITANVTADVEVNFGAGNDTLEHSGSGRVTANGGLNDDNLTGGPADDFLDGGPGEDSIRGRGGADTMLGDTGEDGLIWAVGDGTDTRIDGGSDVDRFVVEGGGATARQMTVSPGVGGSFTTTVNPVSLSIDDVEALTLEGSSAADTFTVNDMTGTSLQSISIDLGPANGDSAKDTVTVNGNGGADTFLLDTIDADPGATVDANLAIQNLGAASLNIGNASAATFGDEVIVNTRTDGDTVTVRGTLAGLATIINTGPGSDTITVGNAINGLAGIDAPLTINGSTPTSGSDYLYIDDSADTTGDGDGILTATNLSGLGLAPGGIDYSGIEHLIVTLGTGSDAFRIASTHGAETVVNANGGSDVINVRTVAGQTTVNGDGGSDTVNVGTVASGTVGNPGNNSGGTLGGIGALLTVNGNAGAGDTVNLDNTGSGAAITTNVTGSAIAGSAFGAGGSLGYGTLENVNLNLGTGSDTVNVRSTSVATTVRTGTGALGNTVNVGSAAPASGGNVNAIAGTLSVVGQSSGDDVLNIDETGDAGINVGTLTAVTLSGLGMAANVDYSAIDDLNIYLGTGTDTFNVRSTSAATLTTVRTGTGSAPNTVNVGSLSPGGGGTVNSVDGKLVVTGQSTGTETLAVDDTGDGGVNIGQLTATTLTGLGMAANDPAKGIEYGGFDAVTIDLGQGRDQFTIASTHGGTTALDAGGADDVVNIRTIDGPTTVGGGDGSDQINVGTAAAGTLADPDNNAGGTLNEIDAALTINGNEPDSGSDRLLVDDTGDPLPNAGTLTPTLISGLDLAAAGITYGTVEHLTVRLGDGGNTFTVNGTHGAATLANQETTTVFTGNGADLVTINDVTDTLTVHGQDAGDAFNVNGTGVGSTANLNGNGGDDDVHVRAIDGRAFVDGGSGDDDVYVTDIAVALPGAAPALPDTAVRTSPTGKVDDIDALLDVEGGLGTDRLYVDGSAAPAPGRSAVLTATTLDGMGLSADGIDYRGLEFLTIWMGAYADTMTVNGTHGGTTSIYLADGDDTVDVNDVSGIVDVYTEQASDTVNIRATSAGSTLSLYGHEGEDYFNVGDATPTLPAGNYPVGTDPPAPTDIVDALVADTVGRVDAVDGLVTIDGGTDADQVNVDDSASTVAKDGVLTGATLRGLGMDAGIDYRAVEDLNLWLGTGADILFIASTHAGTTQVYGGDGVTGVADPATGALNRDDTIAIDTIAGVTTVYGQGGNDLVLVNVAEVSDDVFERTHANGIAATLNLTGNGGSDDYVVNLAGEGEALINVHDDGALNDGTDVLTINGEDAGPAPDDTFLLRRDFVALLNASVPGGDLDQVERVNYDENINGRLVVNGLAGDDRFVADDNSAITTLDGGPGEDDFQIGQIFGTQRDALAGVAPGDEFDTTAVIIGVIRDPDPASATFGQVIFDPTLFSVGQDDLDPATVAAINAAIEFQKAQGLALDGVAYLSDGVSFATTVYGGDNDDVFSVYRNVGTLRLEGEAGDDQFVVRAFVTVDLDADQQAETEINGGIDRDVIQYAINAPVSIDGGDGFDTVIVLGTPFGDNFVVTEDGIFGAGLNVRFENIESATLDTLEGDDNIYVLSTRAGVITTVIGGLGSDLIEVGGDVNPDRTIFSNDLGGRAGVIEHSLSGSTDALFRTAGVNGVAVSVRDAAGGDLVNIGAGAEPFTVTEDGTTIASYLISLISPVQGDLADAPVYLTVSAGMVSTSGRAQDGESILISLTPDGEYRKSLVLTFDDPADLVRTIYVKAVDDTAEEGAQIALISHSINSANAAYEDLPLADVFVNVVDDDKAGVTITEINNDAVFGPVGSPDGITEVLEEGFNDQYRLVLTRAPNPGETVTVTLEADAQVTLSQTVFTFTAADWDSPRLVTITAADDDGRDGHTLSAIRHVITTTTAGGGAGAYDALDGLNAATLDVTVYDSETAGVIVRETGGDTEVTKGGAGDSYFVRLTRAPAAGQSVVLATSTDGQTLTTPSTVTFTGGNWDDWAEITVAANPSAPTNGDPVKVFETAAQDLNRIKGPLIVEGGVGGSVNQPLRPALVLPGETDDASEANVLPVPEGEDLDTLNIFHTDNTDDDSGRLYNRTGVANSGIALTGFEMAGPRLAGTAGAEELFGGGITMRDFEIVEILLGKGDESLTVDATLDGAVTVIHGGGGDDHITVNDRGDGPLVVYGDTSEDRVRYGNDQAAASVHGTFFDNDGDDTIDASGMDEKGDSYLGVVIYGGFGADTIDGSDDDDYIAGGTGGDTIDANGGNDNVYGDSHFNVDPRLFAEDRLNAFDDADPRIAAMFEIPVATPGDDNDLGTDAFIEAAGGDAVEGGDGADIVFGDHGVIELEQGVRRLTTTGGIERLITTQFAFGAGDTIYGHAAAPALAGDDDTDRLFGGQAGDTIDAGNGNNIVFGDEGVIDYGVAGTDIDYLESINPAADGGIDTITTGAGADIVLGGRYGDTVGSGDGNDVVLGDHGRLEFNTGTDGDPATLDLITATDPAEGGADTIDTAGGDDVVIAGTASDRVIAGSGNDTVFGDFADITLANRVTDVLASTFLTDGAADTIFGNENDDVIVGGVGNDLLDGDEDSDLIFGDAVTLERRLGDITSDRFQVLQGLLLYSRSEIPAYLQGDGPAPSGIDAGQVLVDGVARDFRNPTGVLPAWAEYEVTELYHSADIQNDGLHGLAGSFGNDYIAGGAGHDQIFGQLGDDVIQGDGSIDSADTDSMFVGAVRDVAEMITLSPTLGETDTWLLTITPSFDAASDGDDYIEGNGGSDVIFGNLGQDDIVGGSSGMFTLTDSSLRPDGKDYLFGGSGTEIDHDETLGDADDLVIAAPHARDADVIAGDNANIYRIVGTGDVTLPGDMATPGTGDTGGFLSFAYDAARNDPEQIRVRAVELLDYTPGGPDFAGGPVADIGAGDEIHGESGDDAIYGMTGDDVLFGDSESDDLIGGWGNDWISGGQGMDGVIGDDGRIYTGRYVAFDGNGNSTADPADPADYAEPLNGILMVDELDKAIRTPGDILTAIIHPTEDGVLGEIFKTVDLTPFNLDPGMLQDIEFRPMHADDIIYGGRGNDFLHGSAGDDAISGAEALPAYFAAPVNPGNVLGFDAARIEFADYDEEFPRRAIPDFLLNFDPDGDPDTAETANDNFDEDAIFGDLGNDWLVGGPDNDQLFGGYGADLLDLDDDKRTDGDGDGVPGDNYGPDPVNVDSQDLGYGGGGRDVLMANTGGDRTIDWVGEFNSFIVPFAPFGEFTVTRAPTPHNFDFLYQLSGALGADQSRAVDSGNTTDTARNGEPDGELGLVTQKDNTWQDQSGAPIDPQPGNIPGGERLTLRGVDFNNGTTEAFAVDQGVFQAVQGRLEVSSSSLGETASAVFHVGEYLPHYFEITATISTGKPTAGLKANSYVIFDYVSPTDFKYAGINVSTDKLEMGYVDATGWHELVQVPAQLRHSTDYDVLLAINGLTATLVVDNKDILTYTYAPRVDADGFTYGLNYGLVGLGGIGSIARVDNMIVQKLSPEITFEANDTFGLGAAGFTPYSGAWNVEFGRYSGTPVLAGAAAISLFDLDVAPNSYLELEVTVDPASLGGVVFDHYDDGTWKFAGVLADTNQVVIGHVGRAGTIVYDAVADITFARPGDDYTLRVSLQGSTVSVAVLGGNGNNPTWYEVVGHVFNAVTVDGAAGLLALGGESAVDDFAIRTDDPAFISAGEELVAPSLSLEKDVPTIDVTEVAALLDAAVERLAVAFALDSAQLDALRNVEVAVAELPGLVLARNNGSLIEIDLDAAGHGWFVDATPGDDREFDAAGLAVSGGLAVGDIDLLTALAHELGHVLGFEHDSLPFMSHSLSTGLRLAPAAELTVRSEPVPFEPFRLAAMPALEARYEGRGSTGDLRFPAAAKSYRLARVAEARAVPGPSLVAAASLAAVTGPLTGFDRLSIPALADSGSQDGRSVPTDGPVSGIVRTGSLPDDPTPPPSGQAVPRPAAAFAPLVVAGFRPFFL